MYSQQQKWCCLSYLSVTLYIHRLGNFKWEKCLTSIDKRMQKRHTPRILESMNDMDLLSHNDMREATLLLLLAVLVDKKSKNLLEVVNVYRGAAGGMSDHYLVEAKLK